MRKETRDKISSWVKRFPDVFDNTEELALKLGREYSQKIVFPQPDNIFKAFELCPYEDCKVVILGLDPYPGEFTYNKEKYPYATGLSFANPPEASILAPSLVKIRHAVVESGYLFLEQDLTNWARAGCLMLNTALTIERGVTGSHLELWRPFTERLLTQLGCQPGMIFLLWGKEAQKYKKFIDTNYCYIVEAPHPASAVYNGGEWDYKDCFNVVNKHIEDLYGREFRIIW